MDFAAKLSRLGAPPTVHPERGQKAESNGCPSRITIPDVLHDASSRVGRIAPLDAAALAPATLAELACDEAMLATSPRRVLFLDTETTGLQHGAGTLPFLIGLAWFEGDTLRVRQLFLGQPGMESPLLQELADRIAGASLVVSFNGKSFDWPLLKTRFVLNRLPVPPMPPHLDLRHCARRVFKRRKQAGRLVELEQSVLGHRRVGDIDGALIPAVYFDWLRRGQRGLLEQVFSHNAQDVVSMAAILVALALRLDSPEAHDAPEDCLSVAELAVRNQKLKIAEKFALHAAEHARCVRATAEARLLAAKLAAKRRDYAAAKSHLERAASDAGVPRDLRAVLHLRLAQLCEHRFKDFPTAMHHAELGAPAEPAPLAARRQERIGTRLRL